MIFFAFDFGTKRNLKETQTKPLFLVKIKVQVFFISLNTNILRVFEPKDSKINTKLFCQSKNLL